MCAILKSWNLEWRKQEKHCNICTPSLIYGLEFAIDIMKIIFNEDFHHSD